MGDRRLTQRQQRFVREFASGKSATQAAKDAGYSSAYADRQAAQLLGNPQIKAAIQELNKRLAKPAIATIEKRQAWWTKVMFCSGAKLSDRLKASELLGRSQGDFVEKHEHTGKNGSPLVPAIVRIVRPADAKPIDANGFTERQALNGSH